MLLLDYAIYGKSLRVNRNLELVEGYVKFDPVGVSYFTLLSFGFY